MKNEFPFYKILIRMSVDFFKFFLVVIGITFVIFVIRFPFYDDNFIEFIKSGAIWSLVPISLSVIFVIGYWLFEKFTVFKFLFCGLFAFSILLSFVKGCTEPYKCVETRFITCND